MILKLGILFPCTLVMNTEGIMFQSRDRAQKGREATEIETVSVENDLEQFSIKTHNILLFSVIV